MKSTSHGTAPNNKRVLNSNKKVFKQFVHPTSRVIFYNYYYVGRGLNVSIYDVIKYYSTIIFTAMEKQVKNDL